jgi:hypothetical protein
MTTGYQGAGTAGSALNTPAGGFYASRLGKVGVVAPTVVSATRIDLAWPDLHYLEGYSVERSPNGSTGWAEIATPTLPAYSNTGLTTATIYYYRVRGRDYGGYGAYSDVVNATTS